jgi:hypothetical protein
MSHASVQGESERSVTVVLLLTLLAVQLRGRAHLHHHCTQMPSHVSETDCDLDYTEYPLTANAAR